MKSEDKKLSTSIFIYWTILNSFLNEDTREEREQIGSDKKRGPLRLFFQLSPCLLSNELTLQSALLGSVVSKLEK